MQEIFLKKYTLEKICRKRKTKFKRVTALYSQSNYSKHKVAIREVMRQQRSKGIL